MGGHGDFHPVKLDPSIERWSHMRENVFQTFKFTKRTTKHVAIWAVLVPAGLYYLSDKYNLQFDVLGKRRGESLRTNAPQTLVAPEE